MAQDGNGGGGVSPEAIDAVTFDVFGTLVDWRAGVIDAGRELSRRTGVETDSARFAGRGRDFASEGVG